MSSPGVGGFGLGHWQSTMAETAVSAVNIDCGDSGVAIKPMRLKVLYTFDDQNKTNCLARWPHVLQIQTVMMDDAKFIGVIELKTCIQAIVQCSPELVAKLGQDYTVYAYDFSEYDNPLVGQGMLSWALAAASPTPDTLASQSRQLITGRVCKNIQGLFSNGVAETLEVKLRLVPVPTTLQSEYISNMEKYRELSRFMPAGFDHNEWHTFLQSNPGIAQMGNKINGSVPNTVSQRNGSSMEVMNQLLSPSLQQQTLGDPFNNPSNNEPAVCESRGTTPAGGRKTAQKTSRPSSRASVKKPRKPRKSAVGGGNTSGYEEGTDGDEASEAPAKKRAKTTKADWTSKSSFGSGSDSLRVAASTSGSLRLFRPIAIAPSGASALNHLQEIPRAPTPVPSMEGQTGPRVPSQSLLRRDSIASQMIDNPRQYNSPYAPNEATQEIQDQVRMSIESAMTSPERNPSPADTQQEFGSSPPVLRASTFQQSSPPASSPVLPKMPRTDSGFMSGDVSDRDLFEDDDDLRPIDDEDLAVAAKYNRRRNYRPAPPRPEIHHGFAIEEVTPGPPELLPTKMFPRVETKAKADHKPKTSRPTRIRSESTMSDDGSSLPLPKIQTAALSQPSPLAESAVVVMPPVENHAPQVPPSIVVGVQRRPSNVDNARPVIPFPRPSSRMSRTASAGSLTLPTIAASDPVNNVQPSQIWSEAAHPISEAQLVVTGASGPVDQIGTTTSHRTKKNNIRMRLEQAIARGEMPQYCTNCGAIDTPAWRKAWAQDLQGDPGFHEYSDEPGKTTAIDILSRDATGKPTSYRIIKKCLGPDEDRNAYTEIVLCNPCGIWMSKYKNQRPEDRWQKDSEPLERRKRERPAKSRKGTANDYPVATSEAYLQSDAPGMTDYFVFPNDTPIIPTDLPTEESHQTSTAVANQREDKSHCGRSSSVRPAKKLNTKTSGAALAASRRAIQSSPARWVGSEHSPIEIQEDLGSTRRLLFPSPRKDGVPKMLGEVAINVVQPARASHVRSHSKSQVMECSNKENRPPLPLFDDADDELVKLFEEELTRPTRSTTPVQKSPPIHVFKTPTRPTPNHRPLTRSQSKSTKAATKAHQLNQRTPSKSKTPSTGALRRSPRKHHGPSESPFTATLNRLLSESNNVHENEVPSPSRHLDLGLDFSGLPDLGHSSSGGHSDSLNFNVHGFESNQDFFSTDVPMPSSPPRLFNLYEDPLAMGMQGLDTFDDTMWSDFPIDQSAIHGFGSGLMVDDNGHAMFDMALMNTADATKIKVEDGTGHGLADGQGKKDDS